MSDTPEVQGAKKEWFVVDANGVRQHDGLLTEEEAKKLEGSLLTESEGKSGFRRRKQLNG